MCCGIQKAVPLEKWCLMSAGSPTHFHLFYGICLNLQRGDSHKGISGHSGSLLRSTMHCRTIAVVVENCFN